MPRRLLILETSQRRGLAALAEEQVVLEERPLEESRRHARDLVPTVRALCERHGSTPRDLAGVIVSRGPGSYTGLRVGVMSAKTLAYATGCALLAVDTFAALALQAPPEAARLDVLEDAQQDSIYVQSFARGLHNAWQPLGPLRITTTTQWLQQARAEFEALSKATHWVTGPVLATLGPRLPDFLRATNQESWQPRAESLLALGLARLDRQERDDPLALEPLYLRPSRAEEQWQARDAYRAR